MPQMGHGWPRQAVKEKDVIMPKKKSKLEDKTKEEEPKP